MNKYLTFFILLFFSVVSTQAQITGKVVDTEGTPLPGVNVIVKGTSVGTSTDFDGAFKLKSNKGDVLVFSFIGFQNKEIIVTNNKEIKVTMQESSNQLEEVIVTSLGIKKEKKSLGYAATELKSNEINTVKTNNVVNTLAGKVTGVQVTGASNGVASSARVIIRGENSLNLDNNSPLFILDGVPVNNRIFGVGGGATDQADLPTDYGNGVSELNSDDFETVTILKGAAASALYGSRAANGVIVITTKKGVENEDYLGIEFNSSLMVSTALRLPELQKEYGAGWGLKYASNYGTNFGAKLNGNIVSQENYLKNYVKRPFVNRYDLNDFFRQGINISNSISVSSANKKGHYYLSYGNTCNEGIVPNTNLKSDSFRFNGGFNITDKWSVDAKSNYIIRNSDNLTVSGYGSQGVMYTLLWNSINVDLKELKNYWIIKDQEQRRLFSWGDNPWFVVNENINAFKKSRFIGNIATNYKFNDRWNLMLRAGTDQSNDFRWSRRPIGSHRFPKGMYREQKINFSETNIDVLATYQKKLTNFDTKVSVGANKFNQKIVEGFLQGNGLTIPGLYNSQNISVQPTLRNNKYEKGINSVYAFANIGYRNFLYVDLSARNDWSSTLPTDNNSYFYPAFSLSFIPTTAFEMPKFIDFLKLRFNIAQVGKDTDPYNLKKSYNYGTLPGSITNPSQLPNANLKPEKTTSTEFGLEAFLFHKRLSLDFTYYKSISEDQILNVWVSGANGYKSVIRNAGEIQNSGIEFALGIKPIKTEDFEWGIYANFTKNASKVVSLLGDFNTFVIAQGPNNVTVEARPGEQMGDIYGNYYERNPQGSIIYEKGLPKTSSKRKKIGNYNPDWMLGLSTNVKYKGFNLNAQFDIRNGGTIYSYTNSVGQESGILAKSLFGREEGIIGDGVVDNGDGTYSPNTVKVAPETWYYSGAYPRNNAEVNSFDASYIKLRQLSLGYTFDEDVFQAVGVQKLSISLVGSNLFLWTDVPNIDPESQALFGGSLLPGFEVTQLPSTKSYGLKLNIKF